MKNFIPLILICNLIGCAVSPVNVQNDVDMENIYFTFNGLKKAYLDTTNNGVSLELIFHDGHINRRDSIKFYVVPIDDNFNHLGELQRLDMTPYGDTSAKKILWFPTAGIELPISYMYEIGAVYMSEPIEKKDLEWELDTVINDYFIFNVYNKIEEYQQVVDRHGLEPTVFNRE